jgi:hypothetical protein
MKRSHPQRRDPYILETVGGARDLLLASGNRDEALRMKDIIARTGLNRTIAFRLLHALENRGLLQSAGNHQCKSNVKVIGRKRFRMRYAAESEDSPFSAAVTNGLCPSDAAPGTSIHHRHRDEYKQEDFQQQLAQNTVEFFRKHFGRK